MFSNSLLDYNTAQAVMSVLSTGGGAHYLDFGTSAGILTAFVTGAGIAQAAAVLAKPLPEFWTGTSNAPEGFAHVAERGPELRQNKDGSYRYYDKPTVDWLNRGDKVYTADQTAAIVAGWKRQEAAQHALQLSALNLHSIDQLRSGRQAELRLSLGGGQAGLSKQDVRDAFGEALDSRPAEVTRIDRDGLHYLLQEGQSTTEYLHKRNK